MLRRTRPDLHFNSIYQFYSISSILLLFCPYPSCAHPFYAFTTALCHTVPPYPSCSTILCSLPRRSCVEPPKVRVSLRGASTTSQGLSAEPDKILQVNNWERPQTRKKLQGFMGMVNYLAAYAPHLATIAAPLTRLCGATVSYK